MENSNTEKPFVTIDGIQVYAEDLSPTGKVLLARLQRLNSKKATAVADIEEIIGSILHFENLLIADYESTATSDTVDSNIEVAEESDQNDSDS
tara:strand:- start:5723 stop:6001 length:279 start_codon:yes stop_codon:yes gene_type:complete